MQSLTDQGKGSNAERDWGVPTTSDTLVTGLMQGDWGEATGAELRPLWLPREGKALQMQKPLTKRGSSNRLKSKTVCEFGYAGVNKKQSMKIV